MNQSLQPRGMTATVERQDDLLEVVLEAERVPSREALTAFVQKGIANLGVESVRLIRIVGQQTGATLPAWMQELDLAIVPTLPNSALPDPALPDSALPNLQTAPSLEMMEPTGQEPLDLGAESESSALSFNESTEEKTLPESLPDALDFEALNFEDQLNSQELLSADSQQRHLETQLESLWAEQSTASSQDYDLSLDTDEPISEEEFQDLFAEDLSNSQSFSSEFSGKDLTMESVDSVNQDLLADSADIDSPDIDSADMNDLFGEQDFALEPSSDSTDYSFDLGADDLGAEPEPSPVNSSDLFLNDPLDDSLSNSLDDSYEAIVELPSLNPELGDESDELATDLFASSPSVASDISTPDLLISDISISDINSFDENEVDEITLSEDSLEDLFSEDASEDSSDFSVGVPDESAIDAAIVDLFAEEEPEPLFGESQFGESQFGESQFGESQLGESQFGESQFGESQLEDIFAETATPETFAESRENALDLPEPDLLELDLLEQNLPELDLPESDLPELDLPEQGLLEQGLLELDLELDSEFSPELPPEVSHPGEGADRTQSVPSNLFAEELQGLNEVPIEYVFGETIEDPIENPIAQNPSDSSAIEELNADALDVDDLFAEPLPQRDLPLPLLEEQLDSLWAEQEDSSFELEEEPLLSDEPASGTYEFGTVEPGTDEQADFFGQPEESLIFGAENDFLLEPSEDALTDRSDELDLLSNPNAVLLDLPSEDLPPEDLFPENLLEPIAPEDFSLDLSDNPLDEQSDSLFQDLSEDSSEEFFLDDTDSLATLSLDDLEEEVNTSSDPVESLEQDALIDDALIDSAIASLPAEFLDDSFSEQFENPPETPLEIEPSAASADIDLSDFSDFSDNLPDEPLASLIHETSSEDLGIEFLSEDPLDNIDLGTDPGLNPLSQTIELTSETSPDAVPEDADLDLPLDFLGDRTTSSSLRHLPDDDLDNDLALDDNFLNLPDDLLDYSNDSSLENLFPEASEPSDRQASSMEDLMPSQSDAPEDLFPEETIDFLQESALTEASELPADQAEESLTGLPDWDEEIGSMQGFDDLSLVEDDLAGQNLDYALDNDLDEDIGNLSLELDPEVYSDEDTSIAATFDQPWSDPLDDEAEMSRETHSSPVAEVDWDVYEDSPQQSSELSQEQLEAQLEEFDRNSASSNYGTSDRERGDQNAESYAEGNGQVNRPTSSTLITPDSSTSWLLTAALVGVSGLVAGLLGYVLWSKLAAPPTPQPSVAPAPVQPSSVLPSAPTAEPSVVPSPPPAEPVVPPSEPPVP
jgi:hypothetical protein